MQKTSTIQRSGSSSKENQNELGKKKAKKLHIECNQAAALANKERKAKDKALKRIQKRVASRQERGQQREIEGSAVMDSGTTSTVIRTKDQKYVIDTKIPSNKIFTVATGEQARGGTQAKLQQPLRAPATQGEIVPALKHNSLISTSKLADVNYHTVFTPDEVLVYDGEVSPEKLPVWKGWRDAATGLWRVPLKTEVENNNTDTVLMTEKEMTNMFNEHILNVSNLPVYYC